MANSLTQAQQEMISTVTSRMSAEEIMAHVEAYDDSICAPEHDEIIVTAALLGDKTAMLLCHMS